MDLAVNLYSSAVVLYESAYVVYYEALLVTEMRKQLLSKVYEDVLLYDVNDDAI